MHEAKDTRQEVGHEAKDTRQEVGHEAKMQLNAESALEFFAVV